MSSSEMRADYTAEQVRQIAERFSDCAANEEDMLAGGAMLAAYADLLTASARNRRR